MRTRFRAIFPILLMACPPLWARQADAPPPAPRAPEQAEASRPDADAMRAEAKRRYAAEEAACYQKILVNPCLEDARERYMKATIEARRAGVSARESQRKSRRGEVEAEKDRRAAERPVREAEQRERAERHRAEEAASAAGREQKRLEKERRAGENRKKLADDQAKRQLKAEKRAKKQAEQREKKARERAKAEEKAAEKAAGDGGS
jgi:hypothetical protein